MIREVAKAGAVTPEVEVNIRVQGVEVDEEAHLITLQQLSSSMAGTLRCRLQQT